MKYCIDYRNGGMGNTVVAHVLFACQQLSLNLDNFFSDTGDAHKIQRLIHHLPLSAHHLLKFPRNDLTCIVELKSNDWFHVLQYQMSYAKWHKEYPTVENLTKFFNGAEDVDTNNRWINFYNDIRDPLWPVCETVNDIQLLPDYIKLEVEDSYQPVYWNLSNEKNALEFLSKNYYDQLQKTHSKNFNTSVIYLLGDYFNNNYDVLKTVVVDKFNWRWNQQLSDQFYKKMLEANSRYLSWLKSIKLIYNNTINFIETDVKLKFWEQAVLIAKLCQHFDLDPIQLNWNDQSCFLSDNNVSLVNYFKEVKHGKAI